MPVRQLPPRPNWDQLKYQAKDLLTAHAAREVQAAQRIREFHPRFGVATDAEIFDAPLPLYDAQLTIAREAGYPSWSRLKVRVENPTLPDRADLPHHERIEDAAFRQAVDLLDAGDVAGLRALLKQHPQLVKQRVTFEGGNYFRNPALLEFVVENPVRHGRLPANIVEVASVILDAGAERAAVNATLGLVATGRVARECGVQIPLIELLCAHGAEPDGAARAAAGHGEFDAVEALICNGAAVDLPLSAALGRTEDFERLLKTAGEEARALAMAFGAQFGRVDVVQALLDTGVDPNRYNPPGAHSHSTPLHQAALAGHDAAVRLLVERGARLDIKDLLWRGTPADWARHEGQMEIEGYLRAREANAEQK